LLRGSHVEALIHVESDVGFGDAQIRLAVCLARFDPRVEIKKLIEGRNLFVHPQISRVRLEVVDRLLYL
jgi:hypothetical protein